MSAIVCTRYVSSPLSRRPASLSLSLTLLKTCARVDRTHLNEQQKRCSRSGSEMTGQTSSKGSRKSGRREGAMTGKRVAFEDARSVSPKSAVMAT